MTEDDATTHRQERANYLNVKITTSYETIQITLGRWWISSTSAFANWRIRSMIWSCLLRGRTSRYYTTVATTTLRCCLYYYYYYIFTPQLQCNSKFRNNNSVPSLFFNSFLSLFLSNSCQLLFWHLWSFGAAFTLCHCHSVIFFLNCNSSFFQLLYIFNNWVDVVQCPSFSRVANYIILIDIILYSIFSLFYKFNHILSSPQLTIATHFFNRKILSTNLLFITKKRRRS